MPYPTGFQINGSDFNDVYVRAELFTEGGLWASGLNGNGQLGDNSTTAKSSPVQTISGGTNWKLVAGVAGHTAAIKTDGSLWLWGDATRGCLGDNSTTNKSSPVQTVSTGTNWKQVACGNGSHTAAIKTDGTLWSWGNNDRGQLGDNTVTVGKSSPVQTVSSTSNWKQVSCAGSFTAAIKTDGTLWMWGENGDGNLGDNSTTHRSSPVQTVSTGTNWKLVACGRYHTAAIKTDGTLWLWGHNGYGCFGDENIAVLYRSSPVQTVSGGTNWKQVACGSTFTSAIKTDGTLWTWGNGGRGRLGNDSTTHRSSPVQTVSGGTNWKQVACATSSGAAIKTDGTLWLWGNNSDGQLGDNSRTHRSSPVQTVAGGTNWKLVSYGSTTLYTIRDQW